MSNELFNIGVRGDVTIEDDLGQVILSKQNSVHPQNLSRIIARALAGELNSTIFKLALGNGGTYIDATGTTSFRRPNDGVSPDLAGWQSRLYNETYNEVVDEGSSQLGQGAGAFPGGDGLGIAGVRSVKLPTGESQVIVTCVINSQEPTAQLANSLIGSTVELSSVINSTNGVYTFDELGLFTAGLPPTATQGYQDVALVAGKTYLDNTYLTSGASYRFDLTIDGIFKSVVVTPIGTGTGGAVTYTDLKQAIDGLQLGVVAQVSQPGVNTLGNLRLRSITAGPDSSVVIRDMSTGAGLNPGQLWLFNQLGLTSTVSTGSTAYLGLGTTSTGQLQGEEDNPSYPQNERERMLTHLVFSPLQKDASRSWKITYKITVIVQQSN
jgi:hypothetical protein